MSTSPRQRQTDSTDELHPSAALSFGHAGQQTGDTSGCLHGTLAGREPPRARPAALSEPFGIIAARAALAIAPLRLHRLHWAFQKPRSHNKRVRLFNMKDIMALIAKGEAERIGNMVFRKSLPVLFVASTLWSNSVMSHPARNHTPTQWQLTHLPAEEIRRIETEGQKPKHVPANIDLKKITADSKLALISISGHAVCRIMTEKMRQSTLRFNVYDFAILRELRLAERGEGARWHTLTPDGKYYAPAVARQIAIETGTHAIYHSSTSLFNATSCCTCGWSTRLYSGKFSAARDHNARVARHLAEAADASRPIIGVVRTLEGT